MRYFSPIYQALCPVSKPMMSVDAPSIAAQGKPFNVWWVPSLPPSLGSHPPVYTVRDSPMITRRDRLCSASSLILSSLLGWSVSFTLSVGPVHLLRRSYVVGSLEWAAPHQPGERSTVFLCSMPIMVP